MRRRIDMKIGPWTFLDTDGKDAAPTPEQQGWVGRVWRESGFDWSVFDFEVAVHLVTSGLTDSGARSIVIRGDDPADVFAVNLLHETGHVFDHQYMTAGDRLAIAGSEASHWNDPHMDYMNRPNEKFARAFSTAYFPVKFSQAYPAYFGPSVKSVVDARISVVKTTRILPSPVGNTSSLPAVLQDAQVQAAFTALVKAIITAQEG
jgi:hypothetical protein